MEPARIAAITAFAGVPDPELAAVAAAAGELELEAGRPLATEGDFGHALFAIESGSADVVIDGVVVRSVGPGDVVGEIAVLAAGRRTASIVSTSPMRLLVLFKRDVWQLERDAPAASARLRELVSRHLAAADTAS
jgi:CRP-like cAMP-binding protein